MTLKLPECERKRQGRFVRRAEKRVLLTKMMHLRRPSHPLFAVWWRWTPHGAPKHLISRRNQTNLPSNGRTLGEYQISLRDVQRLLTRMALFPKSFDNDGYAYIRLATSALIMDVLAPEQFARLRNGKLQIEEVTQLLGLQGSGAEPNSPANRLTHCWRYVLMSEPGEDTKSIAGQAFSNASNGFTTPDFGRLWADFFDTFQLVSDAK